MKNETKHTPANRPELSFDGCGINGPDEYRTRIATFSNGAEKYGPLFASAPDLLAALKDLVAIVAELHPDADSLGGLESARAAIARATE